MKKILMIIGIGLSFVSSAYECELIVDKHVKISQQDIEILHQNGIQIRDVINHTSDDIGRYAIVKKIVSRGFSVPDKLIIVKFYDQSEEEETKFLKYAGIKKAAKKIKSCSDLYNKIDKRVNSVLSSSRTKQYTKNGVPAGIEIIER